MLPRIRLLQKVWFCRLYGCSLNSRDASNHHYRERRGVRMLESSVELLGGLFLSAPTLLIGSCIVGSNVVPGSKVPTF
jgi:hypothetical protein